MSHRSIRVINKAGVHWEWDNLYSCPVVLDLTHHKIHEGDSYMAHDDQTAKTTWNYMLVAPATTDIHLQVSVQASDEWNLDLYEGATAISGAAIPIYNQNRNFPDASHVTLSHTPTSITGGTKVLRTYKIYSGVGPADTGGSVSDTAEIILKRGETYIMSGVGSSSTLHTEFNWYETGD